MTTRWVSLTVAAGLVTAVPLGVRAQHFPPPIDEPAPAAQAAQPESAPAPKAAKKKKAEKKAPSPAQPEPAPPVVNLPVEPDGQPPPADAAPPATRHSSAVAPPHSIACSGAFAKNSSHIRLAQIFGAQNVTFTE